MSEKLFTDSDEFRSVVQQLRVWAPELRMLAAYASLFWSEERICDVPTTDDPPPEFLN
jgi:hypothetical protein